VGRGLVYAAGMVVNVGLRVALPVALILAPLVVRGHAVAAGPKPTPAARPVSAGGVARPAPAADVEATGVASWSSGASFFNVRSAPRADAPAVATLASGDAAPVLGVAFGDNVDGIDRWYRVRMNGRVAYVLSSGIGFLRLSTPWTGAVSTNAESGVTRIYSLSAPRPDALSDGAFAPDTRMTVLGVVHGVALEPGDDVWYRVSTGSYRPAYVYSAYLKLAHVGAGPVPLPLVAAAEALAVDLDTLRPLYDRASTTPRPPASLVKMMTAAVALDHLGIDAPITIPVGAPSVGAEVGGSAMGLAPGERLSLRDLLYGMLLPSGNDAAYSIAEAVAGSQDAFATLMNAKARAIGLMGTHYMQGYGLDQDGQYTTARDLVRLARYDLAHYPLFARIVGTSYRYIGRGLTHPAFALHSTDELLGVYPGAFGVKTGTTPLAGQNLVTAVRRDGRRIVVVVLGSTDRYADATALLNYAVAVDR